MQLMESKREERVILMLSENCLTMVAIVLVIVSILFKMSVEFNPWTTLASIIVRNWYLFSFSCAVYRRSLCDEFRFPQPFYDDGLLLFGSSFVLSFTLANIRHRYNLICCVKYNYVFISIQYSDFWNRGKFICRSNEIWSDWCNRSSNDNDANHGFYCNSRNWFLGYQGNLKCLSNDVFCLNLKCLSKISRTISNIFS